MTALLRRFPLDLSGLGAVALALAVGLACARLPVTTTALLLIGVAGGLLTLLWPAWAFLLLPLAVPFGELRTLNLGGLAAGGVEALLAGVAGAWLLRGLARRRVVIPRGPLVVPFLLFIGALLLSLPNATAVPSGLKEVVKWGEILAAYLLVLAFADEAGRRRGVYLAAVGGAIILGATLEGLSGVAQSVLRLGPPSYAILGGRLWRAFGEMGQPNPFGGYINLTLLPVLSGLLGWVLVGTGSFGAVQRPSHRLLNLREAGWVVIPLLGAGAVLGLALVLSWSRGAWLGAAVGGGVVVLGWLLLTLGWPPTTQAAATRRRAVTALWGVGLGGLLVLLVSATNLVPASVQGRLGSVTEYFGGFDVLNVEVTDENFAVVERVAHWYAAAGMWADYFWTGVGAGNYAAAYPAYRVPRWINPLGHAHNVYLNLGAETGLIGLLAYLALLVAALRRSLQVAARRRDAARRGLALGVLGVLVALSIHQLFDVLYVHSMGVHLALLLGLVDAADSDAA
ncbi:MAG: O-antigen ligase family protein [Anaerolineae bacterium]|nr:O-antigen ligase family protein [Anaerolineae bacterium]